jgi:hypothetical protein
MAFRCRPASRGGIIFLNKKTGRFEQRPVE